MIIIVILKIHITTTRKDTGISFMRKISIHEIPNELKQKVDEVAKTNQTFSKAVATLREIKEINDNSYKENLHQFRDNLKQIANLIIKKFNCADFSRIFRIANNENEKSDHIKKLYSLIQKNKCFFANKKFNLNNHSSFIGSARYFWFIIAILGLILAKKQKLVFHSSISTRLF